jgi:hypothetical protein
MSTMKEMEMEYEDDDDYQPRESQRKERNKRRRKKKANIGKATSSFDSNVLSNDAILKLFIENDFETKISECYLVYADELAATTTQQATSTTCDYRVRYDVNMNLSRIETMPIKWLSVDIRNCGQTKAERDVRFMLTSQKCIAKDQSSTEGVKFAGFNASVSKSLRKGIIVKDTDDNETLRVSPEFKDKGNIFVRHSKFTKFYGKYDNWKAIFDLAKVKLPSDVSTEFLEHIRVSFCESHEFSDNDAEGNFAIQQFRKEILLTFKLEHFNSMKSNQIRDLIILNWFLAQTFLRI